MPACSGPPSSNGPLLPLFLHLQRTRLAHGNATDGNFALPNLLVDIVAALAAEHRHTDMLLDARVGLEVGAHSQAVDASLIRDISEIDGTEEVAVVEAVVS